MNAEECTQRRDLDAGARKAALLLKTAMSLLDKGVQNLNPREEFGLKKHLLTH
jgi:hypothetical protein